MRISVVTSCGNRKSDIPMPARRLYKSPRITAVYNRKGNHDMYILSAEHGLVPSEKIIASYNRIMDEKRAEELIPEIREVIKNYDVVIFFKAGARGIYEKCLSKACDESGVRLMSFGSRSMQGINELESKIRLAEESKI